MVVYDIWAAKLFHAPLLCCRSLSPGLGQQINHIDILGRVPELHKYCFHTVSFLTKVLCRFPFSNILVRYCFIFCLDILGYLFERPIAVRPKIYCFYGFLFGWHVVYTTYMYLFFYLRGCFLIRPVQDRALISHHGVHFGSSAFEDTVHATLSSALP
jgi:hypothetical protein